MILKLKSKKYFILGGSGTIGSIICRKLFQNGQTIINLDLVDNLKIKSKNYIFVKFDCSKGLKSEQLLKKIVKSKGVPDAFVNVSYPSNNQWSKSSFKKINYKNFKDNLEIHLASYSWSAKIIADQMVKKKIEGSIVLMSSIYSLVAQDIQMYNKTNLSENFSYPIIKGGVNALTKQLASYYGKFSIRVNAICLGGIQGKVKGKKINQDRLFIKRYKSKTFLKRMCKSNDVFGPIYFLTSDLSSYITGSLLVVDGGYTSI